MKTNRPKHFLTALFAGLLVGLSASAEAEVSEAEKLFALKVQPLLREKCLGCHGKDPKMIEGGFDIRSRASLLSGGETFAKKVLVPGKAEQSKLYAMVRRVEEGYEMPPKEAEKLSRQETWWVRDWINGGAPWPSEERVAEIYRRYAEGVTVETSGGLSEEWTQRKYKTNDLWAYQPYWADTQGVLERFRREKLQPIDGFLNERLRAAGLKSAAQADRRRLIRRATFDLWGLPPDPDDVEKFVHDPRSDEAAFAAVIDRLLASPHYGEQWARHWLDVVRYADSSGFANDWVRPNAWRYRDYVIRAFNDDKPYDRFVMEQLAGDELAQQLPKTPASEEARTELLIAAGFLRMGPWEHTGMSVAKVTRQQFLDDVTDSVGQVFLAHALQCCRCHDHKFDPVPTRDYYSIQAVFSATQFAEVAAPWLPTENLKRMDDGRRYYELRRKENHRMLSEIQARLQKKETLWFKKKGLPYKDRQEARKAKAPMEDIPQRVDLLTADEFGRERIGRKWQTKFDWEIDAFEPVAFSVYNGKTRRPRNSSGRIRVPQNPLAQGVLEKTAILKGGDPFSPSHPVSPGVLSAVKGNPPPAIPAKPGGRRLAFARWVTSPQNPLTARVMANRVWDYHFGRGLAGNPNNFGATGKKPTHPRLLDWLAGELIGHQWSIKHLHRVIMNSAAYRRSSIHPDPKAFQDKDPADELYSVFRPRRLTAEEIRDSMLKVSGELNTQSGGIPARPDMNLEAALQPRMIMGTFAPSYVPDPLPAQRNRRTIYALKLRGHRDPFLETFNQPGSEKSCEIRDTSTVTPQALTLFNGDETYDRALALAARVLKETNDEKQAIQRIFQLAYGRPAEQDEISDSVQHWHAMQPVQAKIRYQPRRLPITVVRQANEENTGELFTFTEKLFEHEDYVPDLEPHQVDARTRALADVCLAILNSNEFVYVY